MDRLKLIKLIHIAKRELRLDDDTYRQLLSRGTSKTSTRDMSIPQLNKVLQVMKKQGVKINSSKKAGSPRRLDDAPQSKKIRSLWLTLADNGIVRDRSETALAHWVKRETGVEALQWLSSEKASQVIEKLKQWQHRVEKST